MKAYIPRIIFGFFVAIIFILIIVTTIIKLPEVLAKGSAEELLKITTLKSYSFDINDFLVDPADPNASDSNKQNEFFGIGTGNPDPAFCINLRKCIEMNIKGGQRCLITYKVKPYTHFDPNDVWETIRNRCPLTDIKEELYSKTGRKICKFRPDSLQENNNFREDNISLIDYEPEIHNCYLPSNLGSFNVLNDVDSFNYLYSGRGNIDGYDFENGGTVRIVVTNVSIKNDPYATCSYSLYVCGQNAIANNTEETPVKVFKKIQYLNERELYFNETIYYGVPYNTIPVNIYGYYPHMYEFSFSGTYQNKEALVDAVDAGMWEWNKIYYSDKGAMKYLLDSFPKLKNIYFSYSPLVFSDDATINFDSGCWRSEYELNDPRAYWRPLDPTNYILFNRGFTADNNKIRMVLGIKKIAFQTSISAKLVFDPVTFCSSTSQILPPPQCSDYPAGYVCILADIPCSSCPKCSGYKINQWKEDRCVDSRINCGYNCVYGECGVPATCDKCETWDPGSCSCIFHGGPAC